MIDTVKYDLAAIHGVNSYVWSRLKQEFGMSESEYSGLIPIVPGQDVPELSQMDAAKPYIVYTYMKTPGSELWEEYERCVYRILSNDEERLREVSNFLYTLLRRYEWTADEINSHILSGQSSKAKKFYYLWTSCSSLIGPDEFTTEGGRQEATLSFQIAYVRDNDGQHGSLMWT
jgi:hypothetical protein